MFGSCVQQKGIFFPVIVTMLLLFLPAGSEAARYRADAQWLGLAFEHASIRGGVVFVNGANRKGPWNGRSWKSAFRTVQEGLAAARRNQMVWVAGGHYTPDQGEGRKGSFKLPSWVGLYGGFSGTEHRFSQRNWEKYPTILSGDIGRQGDKSDNLFHVVTGADGAILDGFIVEQGNGIIEERNAFGQRWGSSPTKEAVHACRSQKLGSVCAVESENSALTGSCAMSRERVMVCVPRGGAVSSGNNGGLETRSSAADLLRKAGPGVGAGMLIDGTTPWVRNVLFRDNDAVKGGGLYIIGPEKSVSDRRRVGKGTVTLINVHFENNHALERGGGLANDLGVSPHLINVIFKNNRSGWQGGGIDNHFGASPLIVNGLFVGNHAVRGGAISNDGSSSPTIVNTTFTGNLAEDLGAALYQGSYGWTMIQGREPGANAPVVINSILWGNRVATVGPAEVANWHESEAHISFSTVQGGWPGKGNLTSDPLFVNPKQGDYRLSRRSPARGKGAAEQGSSHDLNGVVRLRSDMGALQSGGSAKPLRSHRRGGGR
ncbi:MAG: hypothetical protein HQL50_07340 [Magnetococcales bacterium]|nr:hypothetical protein [Magnetococcales bacterium]